MRVSNIIVAIALIVGVVSGESNSKTSAEDAPTGLRGHGRKLYYSWPSYYYGYGMARKRWLSGKYSCTSNDAEKFESYVKKYIMSGTRRDSCSMRYQFNKKFIMACRDGAEDIAKDKMDECFASVDQCEGIGEAVSGGIVAMHCELTMAAFMSKRQTWPESCKKIGIEKCQKKVSNKDNYKKYSKRCTAPGKSTLKKLNELCVAEVENYLS